MLSQSTSTRLATQLEVLPFVLGRADHQALTRRPASGEWSAHENLAHLARYHEMFIERIRRILTEDKPHLPRYRAEEDPEWPKWPVLSPDEALRHLNALRGDLIAMVKNLTPDQFNRAGVHPVFGEMTIPYWIEFFLLHEAHHLYVVMNRARGT